MDTSSKEWGTPITQHSIQQVMPSMRRSKHRKCSFKEAWVPAPVKVRMGIHTGDAQTGSDGQYSGYTTLAWTQRIMSVGHGGQVLLSGATRERVRDSLPAHAELVALGEGRLKGPAATGAPVPAEFRRNSPPANFPPQKRWRPSPITFPYSSQPLSVVKEIAEVKQELAAHRLVTLTGPGAQARRLPCRSQRSCSINSIMASGSWNLRRWRILLLNSANHSFDHRHQ